MPEPEIAQTQQALGVCGNGVLEPEDGEECDDGNSVSGDGCSSGCKIEDEYVCFGSLQSVCTLPDRSDAPSSYGYASHARSLKPMTPFVGRSFWTAFPQNGNGVDLTSHRIGVRVTGTPGTVFGVYNYANAQIGTNVTIPGTGMSIVTLTPATYHVVDVGGGNRGIEVRANAPVRVIGTNEAGATADSWAVWSTESLGTDYVVLDASSEVISGYNRQIVVVGTEAATSVNITGPTGTPSIEFTLGKGGTYRYRTPSPIVGFSVTGTKPIAVLAGTELTRDVSEYGDITAEQVPPVKLWSREYVAGPGFAPTRNSKVNHVVVAAEDNTAVEIRNSIGGLQTFTLNARMSNMFVTGATTQYGYHIKANKPIAVASNVGAPSGSTTGNWDPTLITWPPVAGYVTEAFMPVSGIDATYTNSLTIITRDATTSSIRVNSAAVTTGWNSIPSTGYSFVRYGVSGNENRVEGLGGAKFAAIAFGGGANISYGYSSPYDIAAVGSVTTCYLGEIPPDYEDQFLGSEACDQDDKAGIDDEDAISGALVIQHGIGSYTLAVPCHDEYFGQSVNSTVHGFIDFNRSTNFTGAGKHAFAPCVGSTPTTAGTATLTWSGITWGTPGPSVIRLRICEQGDNCSGPTGPAKSGEVEDHPVRLATCGDGIRDTWEECDDHNTTAGDGCSPTCEVEPGFTCVGDNPSVCTITQPPTISSPST
ncbi:MAG: DUF4215 domain-containing protein, partial [Polyangiaceae bacterium]|nr:DUF4215 domain-containing protein [Polyangiaceae bacterium]